MGGKLTNCQFKPSACVNEKLAKGRTSYGRSGYLLAVRSDHQVLISKWLQTAGRSNREQNYILSDHTTKFW
jgi:hypothetical protein